MTAQQKGWTSQLCIVLAADKLTVIFTDQVNILYLSGEYTTSML